MPMAQRRDNMTRSHQPSRDHYTTSTPPVQQPPEPTGTHPDTTALPEAAPVLHPHLWLMAQEHRWQPARRGKFITVQLSKSVMKLKGNAVTDNSPPTARTFLSSSHLWWHHCLRGGCRASPFHVESQRPSCSSLASVTSPWAEPRGPQSPCQILWYSRGSG